MGNVTMARMTKIDAPVLTLPPIGAVPPPQGISAGIAVSPDGAVLALMLTPADGTAVVALLSVDTFANLADLLTLAGDEMAASQRPEGTGQ